MCKAHLKSFTSPSPPKLSMPFLFANIYNSQVGVVSSDWTTGVPLLTRCEEGIVVRGGRSLHFFPSFSFSWQPWISSFSFCQALYIMRFKPVKLLKQEPKQISPLLSCWCGVICPTVRKVTKTTYLAQLLKESIVGKSSQFFMTAHSLFLFLLNWLLSQG